MPVEAETQKPEEKYKTQNINFTKSKPEFGFWGSCGVQEPPP